MEIGDIEENSGIEFPGDALEHVIGTSLTFDRELPVDEVHICEVGIPNFQYRFKKEERAFIGLCEWCNKTNYLSVMCKCKRVRYCDKDCTYRDEHYHVPNCSARVD